MAASRALDKERSEALAQMNLSKILRAYIQQMVDEVPGYKAMLLDKETMRICSTLYGRTELGEHNVVHVERLDASTSEAKEHMELKAVCVLRPTRENVTALKRELRQPRYQSYHLYFTNLVNQMHLQDLAEVDALKEQIQQVQEFYADFMALDVHHFTIPTVGNELLINPRMAARLSVTEYELTDRCVQGLSALFLALRRRPIIRYHKGSEASARLAESLYGLTYQQQRGVFDFGSRSAPLVLLLDRRDDPVTPLLTQWTYQAMIHELVGIVDNTLKLTSAKVSEQFREIVLDAASDDFFARHAYSNYGDVGLSVKELVDKFAATSERHKAVSTLEDMQRFMLEHTDFTRAQTNVSKHVAVMSELSERVSGRNLMELSMLEQELANPAASLSAAQCFDELAGHLKAPGTFHKDRARLAMLYALRFEEEAARLRAVLGLLSDCGMKEAAPGLYAAAEGILAYAGADRRAGDLYGKRSILGKARNVFKGLQGVDNVYTQHTPLLVETLTQVQSGALPATSYPFMAGNQDESVAWQAAFKARGPAECIVFILGGTTYEESRAVHDWNAKQGPGGMRVILGGSCVLNSDAFLTALGGGVEARAGEAGGTSSRRESSTSRSVSIHIR